MPKLTQEYVDRLFKQHYESFKIRWATGLEGAGDFLDSYLKDLAVFLSRRPTCL